MQAHSCVRLGKVPCVDKSEFRKVILVFFLNINNFELNILKSIKDNSKFLAVIYEWKNHLLNKMKT